jgi:hypothetical protein
MERRHCSCSESRFTKRHASIAKSFCLSVASVLLISVSILGGAAEVTPLFALEAVGRGQVVARSPDGLVHWSLQRAVADGALNYEYRQDGMVVIDRTMVVDRWGRVVERIGPDGALLPMHVKIAETLTWDVPVQISDDSSLQYSAETAAVIDSSGDAWVVMLGEGLMENVQVTHSAGSMDTWTAPELLYESGNSIFPPASIIDANDRITVAFREINSAARTDELRILRYVPGTGWSGPQLIYSADNRQHMFQNVYAAGDDRGNVVVCVDGDNRSTMFAFVYDAATDTWSDAVRLPQASVPFVYVPTVVQNRSGSSVYALYQIPDGDSGAGIYARRFRSGTRDWAPAQRVPGTASAELPGGSHTGSRILSAVDDQGNLTVPFYRSFALAPPQVLHLLKAARLESGRWAAPVTLNASLAAEGYLTDFADADSSTDGGVMFVFDQLVNGARVVAAHYSGTRHAWDPLRSIYADSVSTTTRARVAFLDDGSAVASFYSRNSSGLSSRLFNGTAWVPGFFPIPGEPTALFHETTAAGLNVVMVYSTEDTDVEYATWWTAASQARPMLRAAMY